MLSSLKSELIKLKGNWLISLSIVIALLLPIITFLMTTLSNQAHLGNETKFIQLVRQNHIFLTLLVYNLLFSLIATNLFHKEYQYRTIVDILAIPVNRSHYLLSKEIILFLWFNLITLISYSTCLIISLLLDIDGLNFNNLTRSLWRYFLSTNLAFVPIQLVILITLLFKNYAFSLGFSLIALVGSIIDFNTTDLIFIYPFSISFVITNFQTTIAPNQLQNAMLSLFIIIVFSSIGISLSFRSMDV